MWGVTFSSTADEPDFKSRSINLTFYSSEEEKVDQLVKTVRRTLLNDSDIGSSSNDIKFIYSVVKSFIRSNQYWSLEFQLSDKYELTENTQA